MAKLKWNCVCRYSHQPSLQKTSPPRDLACLHRPWARVFQRGRPTTHLDLQRTQSYSPSPPKRIPPKCLINCYMFYIWRGSCLLSTHVWRAPSKGQDWKTVVSKVECPSRQMETSPKMPPGSPFSSLVLSDTTPFLNFHLRDFKDNYSSSVNIKQGLC